MRGLPDRTCAKPASSPPWHASRHIGRSCMAPLSQRLAHCTEGEGEAATCLHGRGARKDGLGGGGAHRRHGGAAGGQRVARGGRIGDMGRRRRWSAGGGRCCCACCYGCCCCCCCCCWRWRRCRGGGRRAGGRSRRAGAGACRGRCGREEAGTGVVSDRAPIAQGSRAKRDAGGARVFGDEGAESGAREPRMRGRRPLHRSCRPGKSL